MSEVREYLLIKKGESLDISSWTNEDLLASGGIVSNGFLFKDGENELCFMNFENGDYEHCLCNTYGVMYLSNITFSGNTGVKSSCLQNENLVEMSDVRFINNGGPAILNLDEGTLILRNAVFSGNTTDEHFQGGAITNYGNLELYDCTFSCNIGGEKNCFTGTIYSNGVMTVSGVTFVEDPSVTDREQGIENISGVLKLAGSLAGTTIRKGDLYWALENTISSDGNFNYALDCKIYPLTDVYISVASRQVAGTYLLSNDLEYLQSIICDDGDKKIILKNEAGERLCADDWIITDENATYSYTDDVNQRTYTIYCNDAGQLLFDVEMHPRFVNGAWKEGDAVNLVYEEKEYSGTVGDGVFYNDSTAARADAASTDNLVISVGNGTGSNAVSVAFDGAHAVIAAGEYVKFVIGGYIATEDAEYEAGSDMKIEAGTFAKSVNAGDVVTSSAVIVREGDIDFKVSGGIFSERVAGGLFYNPNNSVADKGAGSVCLVGNVNLTISGGTFNGRVYGGNNAKSDALGRNTTINGDVNLLIDVSNGHSVVFNENIVAGSRGAGEISGSTNVTITGLGSNLAFGDNSYLFGGSNSDIIRHHGDGTKSVISYVQEGRNLIFSAFTGDFNAEIRLFDSISFADDSAVDFTDEKLELSSVDKWNFQYGSSASGLMGNDFAEDEIVFDMSGYESGEWCVLTGEESSFDGWKEASRVSFGGADDALFNEDGGYWSDGEYKMQCNAAADAYVMTVSRLA